nr:wd40 repeat-containing protein hos15 [Quercus suber]
MVTDVEDKVIVKPEDNGVSAGPEPMDISTTLTSQAREIPSSDVTILEGRTSEVCACAWSPTGSFLASGVMERYLQQVRTMGKQEFGVQMFLMQGKVGGYASIFEKYKEKAESFM